MRTVPLSACLLLVACGGPDTARWAVDQVFLEPTDDGVRGVLTWDVYADPWERSQEPRHHVCGVIVPFEASARVPDADCSGCTEAWTLTGVVQETDCVGLESDPRWTALQGIALGDLPATIADGAPYDATRGGWVDYGEGWEPHGWAWAERLDQGAELDSTWDGVEAFRFEPAWAWDLAAP